jgi:serine/threonine-protein kinase
VSARKPSAAVRLLRRATTRSSFSGQLSPELQADAARRLGSFALVVSGVCALIGTAEVLVCPHAALGIALRLCLVGLSMVLALSLHLAISHRGLRAALALDLGLGFEVIHALTISIVFYAASLAPGVAIRGWTPATVWMFMYPLIVPTPPRRVVVASFATALMDPLGMWINVLAGAPPLPPSALARIFVPTFTACLLVPIAARISYGLTIEVKRAREMGSYRLVERLGRGGMGEVWRAQHRMLARPAAIKLIRPASLGAEGTSHAQELAKRFEREAQATAALRSPHTIVVYDYGIAQDGTFHYVMELLEGYSLQSLVERFGPVPAERAVYMLLQACHSLAEAHAAGMVHRDIKPANLFTCRLGIEVDFVKVLDFGLVKTQGVRSRGAEALTIEGAFTGTPGYMPPEVVLGTEPVDGRADLYALGCVAYWLLTGHKVFEEGGAMQMVVDHVRTPPTPPSQRTSQAIPLALEQIVLDCLAKDPAARPASARELARQLASLELAEAWTEERARLWWLQHPPIARADGEDPTTSSVELVTIEREVGSLEPV